jgi:hypothetical protein
MGYCPQGDRFERLDTGYREKLPGMFMNRQFFPLWNWKQSQFYSVLVVIANLN